MRYTPPLDPPRWGNTIGEQLMDEALAVASVPGDVLRESVRPPLPQVRLFPPRFGYMPYGPRQAHIGDIIQAPRITDDRRIDWTGTGGGYSATSRPSMEQP